MGQEVADARGYENWDDPQELLNYLCDVLLLHDKFIEQQDMLEAEPEQMVPFAGVSTINPNRVIRVTVRKAMCEPGARILNVLDEHGYTPQQFTKAASTGHWEMDAHTLEEFERGILAPDYSYIQMSTQFGLTPKGVRKFRRFWPQSQPPATVRGVGNRPHNIRMRELITQGMRTNDIVSAIKAEFGITITKSAVSQIKKRYNLSSK